MTTALHPGSVSRPASSTPFAGRYRSGIRQFLLPLLLLVGFATVGQGVAATLTVSNIADAGVGSLRAALSSAEAGDRIVFASGVNGTITLTSGEIPIAKSLAIQGPGANELTITSNRISRAFYISGASDVSISGLTIADCAPGGGNGGAIHCLNAIVSINGCVLRGNSGFSGGAIGNHAENGTATLTIVDSTLFGNTARSGGGGVSNLAFTNGNATVIIVNSTFSGNAAASTYQFDTPTGGGILNQSNSGNATIRIMHSTFSENHVSAPSSSYYGDTIANKKHAGGNPTVEVGHSIIQSNGSFHAFANSGGTIISHGHNICNDEANGDTTVGPGGFLNAVGDRRNTDPRLAPLANNGGATPTHGLSPESPAIDAGDPSFERTVIGIPVTNDQRGSGYSRLLKGVVDAVTPVVDIGALEHFPAPLLDLTGSDLATTVENAGYDLAAAIEIRPPGGVFSGSGVSGGMFDPGKAGVGVHSITYTVVDGSNSASVSFEIVVYPTPTAVGIYNGLVSSELDSTPHNERTGLIRVSTIGNTGRFTGFLLLSGTRYPFSGVFDETGTARFGKFSTPNLVLKRPKSPDLDLKLRVTLGQPNSDKLSGTLSEGDSAFAAISADRAFYTAKKNPVAPMMQVPTGLLGNYTIILAPNTPEQQSVPVPDYPQGYGVGVLTIAKNGKARVAGTLADGTPIIYVNSLSKTNAWPFYAAIGGGTGSLSGVALVRETSKVSDLDGIGLTWFRAGNPKAKSYPGGWPDGITVDLLGSKFVSPPKHTGESPLPGLGPVTTGGNAELQLSGANLPTTGLSSALNITPKGKVNAVQGGTESLSLRLAAVRKALFSGTFTEPITNERVRLRGVIFQKQQAGFGYFLGGSRSGIVTLTPK